MSLFRPIAPAKMDVYAASCNPPRRAKRARSLDSDGDGDDNENPPPKRRGRRPGTISRAAREAQRKMNHSLIEKARRTKINDALATLRALVPAEYRRAEPDGSDDDDDDDPKKQRKAKTPPEKEFKLEILVRTVAYLQDLTDRVRLLEREGCPRCSEPISFADPDDTPRLPSISAWLPEGPQSPVVAATSRSTQLPTPPTSATCAPATTGYQIPPVLTLPSPSTLLPSAPTPTPTTHIQPCFSGFSPRSRPSRSSPAYTPEDETAASLLLRMSTTSPRTAPVPTDAAYALTPSRLLGLSAER